MLDKPNAWCVTGIPGAGKSNLSMILAATFQGFATVERDIVARKNFREFDRERTIQLIERRAKPFRTRSELKECELDVCRAAFKIREKLRKALKAMNWPGFENCFVTILYEQRKLNYYLQSKKRSQTLGCGKGALVFFSYRCD